MGKLIGNELWAELCFGELSTGENGEQHKRVQFAELVQVSDNKNELTKERIDEMCLSVRKGLERMAAMIERHKTDGR